jgi:peptidoglycan/xylan/chitin deacetylase (PgdA/CDA1 family)
VIVQGASGREKANRSRLDLAVMIVILALAASAIVLVLLGRGALGTATTPPTSMLGAASPSGDVNSTTHTRRPAPPTTKPLSWSATKPATTSLPSMPSALPAASLPLRMAILTYHYVDSAPPMDGPYAQALTVDTVRFREQLDYLVQNGFKTVTLPQLYLAMAGLMQLPPKSVALTFDDGGLDNYTVAFPELEARGLVATFFVITTSVGEQGRMSWDDLREMQDAGMCIGSHTARHPDLTMVDNTRLNAELVDSRAAIEAELGTAPVALAYPAGRFDDRVVRAATEAGYLLAVTTQPGVTLEPGDPYRLPRVAVSATATLDDFAQSLP